PHHRPRRSAKLQLPRGLPQYLDQAHRGQEVTGSTTNEVIVEFFGIPRQRAGCAELRLTARTVADLLARVEERCPKLRGLITGQGRLTKEFLVSINGERFVTDVREELESG